MANSFTLEDVRIVYELIKECTVDKSNFRKKIIKYCEKVEEKEDTKNGKREVTLITCNPRRLN